MASTTSSAASKAEAWIEAEYMVLGALMAFSDIGDILGTVTVDDFQAPQHQVIFGAIADLSAAGKTSDLVAVLDELRRSGKAEAAGGAARIQECLEYAAPSMPSAMDHVGTLKRRRKMRMLGSLCKGIAKQIDGSGEMSDQEIEGISARILGAMGEQNESGRVKPLEELCAAMEIKRRGYLTDPDYPRSGIETIDREIDLFKPGALTVIAGRPRMGKTTFMRELILGNKDRENRMLVLTLEESEEELRDKLVCSKSRVEYRSYMEGRIDTEGVDRMVMGLADVASISADVYEGTADAARICLLVRRQMANGKAPRVVFIDHLHRMRHPMKPGEGMVQAIGKSVWALKTLAQEMNGSVILLSQLNRGPEHRGEGGRPMLADLRESGAIEQEADNVLFVWGDPAVDARTVTCAKQRGGPTFEVDLFFNRRFGRFFPMTGPGAGGVQ